MSEERILLVGESNPWSEEPHHALYPYPEHASGGRLAAHMGYSAREYLRLFDRVDLLRFDRGRWSAPAARAAATALTHRRRILLGAKVAAAHNLVFVPLGIHYTAAWSALILPHPSARCRLWTMDFTKEARHVLKRFMEPEIAYRP